MEKEQGFLCEKCIEDLGNTAYSIFLISVFTKDSAKAILYEIKEIIEILDNWIKAHPIHLSATELLLTRCDQVLLALEEELKVEVSGWGFRYLIVCQSCFDEHCKDYPLR
jgi:hypothetical protein